MFLISATLSLYLIRALLSHGIPPFLFTNKIGVVRGVMRSILSYKEFGILYQTILS